MTNELHIQFGLFTFNFEQLYRPAGRAKSSNQHTLWMQDQSHHFFAWYTGLHQLGFTGGMIEIRNQYVIELPGIDLIEWRYRA